MTMSREDDLRQELELLTIGDLRIRMIDVMPAYYPADPSALTAEELTQEILFLETYCG